MTTPGGCEQRAWRGVDVSDHRGAVARRATGAVVAAGAVLLGVLVGCAGVPAGAGPGLESTRGVVDGQVASVDGPGFDSVAALAASSDAVVRGVFVARTGEAHDAGLVPDAPAGATGLPVELWEFRVDATLVGDVTGTITVTQPAEGVDGAVRTAAPGRESLLFLRAHGDGVHAVTGLGAGSFAVTGGRLTAPQGVAPALAEDVERLGDVAQVAGVVAAG